MVLVTLARARPHRSDLFVTGINISKICIPVILQTPVLVILSFMILCVFSIFIQLGLRHWLYFLLVSVIMSLRFVSVLVQFLECQKNFRMCATLTNRQQEDPSVITSGLALDILVWNYSMYEYIVQAY